jgi:hypothetical protein
MYCGRFFSHCAESSTKLYNNWVVASGKGKVWTFIHYLKKILLVFPTLPLVLVIRALNKQGGARWSIQQPAANKTN